MLIYFKSYFRFKPSCFSISVFLAAVAVATLLSLAPCPLVAQTATGSASLPGETGDQKIRDLITLKQQARYEFAKEDFKGLADTLDRIRTIDSDDLSLVLYGQILKRHLDAKKLADAKTEPNPFLRMLPAEKPEVRPQPETPKPTPVVTPVLAPVEVVSQAASSTGTEPVVVAQATLAPTPTPASGAAPIASMPPGPPAPPSFLDNLAAKARDADPALWGGMIVGGVCLIFLGLWLLRWSRSEPLPAEGVTEPSAASAETEQPLAEEVEKPHATLSDILTSKLAAAQEDPNTISRETVATVEPEEEEPYEDAESGPPRTQTAGIEEELSFEDAEEVVLSVDETEPEIITDEEDSTPSEPVFVLPETTSVTTGEPQTETLSEEDFVLETDAPEEETILVLDDILTTTDNDEDTATPDDSTGDGGDAPPAPFPMDSDTLFHSDDRTRTHVDKGDDTYFNSDAETRASSGDEPDSNPGEDAETGRNTPGRETFFGSDDETRQGDPKA